MRLDIPGVPGASSVYDINDLGQVVGGGRLLSGYSGAFVYSEADGVQTLAPFGARAINNLGEMVGGMDGSQNAFIRSVSGDLTDIGTPGGNASPYRLNDLGSVIAFTDASPHSWLYDRHQWIDLDPKRRFPIVNALGINNSGQVVGHFIDRKGEQRAFVYEDGNIFDLNDLIPKNSGCLLYSAVINDAGQIAGGAECNGVLGPRAFLLIPTGLAGCDFSIAPTSETFQADGGSGTVDVATQREGG